MSNDLGVRVTRETGLTPGARVGKIIFPPMMLREQLLKRGVVEQVEPEPVSETKMVKRGRDAR